MKNLKSQLNFWIGLLAVCLLPISAPAAGQSQSGIMGQIDAPGLVWTVEVFSASGVELVNLHTDKHGLFEVNLSPGTYFLTPIGTPPPTSPGHPMPMFIIEGPSTKVTVVKNKFTHVVLPVAQNVSPSPAGSTDCETSEMSVYVLIP